MRIFSWTAAIAACGLALSTGLAPVSAQGFNNPTARPPIGATPVSGGTGAGATAPAAAAQPRAASESTPIVVIDVSEVFKNHARFKAQMDELKEDAKKLESAVQATQGEMVKKSEKLKEFQPGSKEFKTLEEQLAREGSDMKVSVALRQKDIGEREAKIYFNTYNEIYDLVREFSERNNVRLVLRYSKQEMDPTKRDTVLQGVNRPIVYQRNLDITDFIISQVNRTASNAGVGGTRPQLPNRPAGTLPR